MNAIWVVGTWDFASQEYRIPGSHEELAVLLPGNEGYGANEMNRIISHRGAENLGQWISDVHQSHLEGLSKHRLLDSTPEFLITYILGAA